MNVATERAREACESCRRSHKKCTYDDNSTRCIRCEKRDTPCSLFETTAVAIAQQGPPTTLAVVGSTPDSWAGNSASSNFTHQFPPQGDYYWGTNPFTADIQGGHPAHMMFQSPTNQYESEQPQDALYSQSNVFRDGT